MQGNENFQLPIELSNLINDSAINSGASTSSSSTSTSSTSSVKRNIDDDDEMSPEEEMAIFDNLKTDLHHLEEDDEYLTFTLDKETQLLNQYKRALQK
jgi:hypothetical protein